MIAGVMKEDMAVATGSEYFTIDDVKNRFYCAFFPVTYLFRTTGQVLGVSISGSIFQAILLQKLRLRIQGPESAEVSSSALFSQLPDLP